MPRPILTKFRMNYDLRVSVHSYTNFELDNSKFAQDTQFRESFQKIQSAKIKLQNRFW